MVDSIEMLETLKTDYLNMRFEVEFDKYVTSGIAEGLTVTEKMHFVDWADATDWAYSVNKNATAPFTILEMRNPANSMIVDFADNS
jgi:hypothetical protein|tara:strand:+ start:10369 stop:10626 length:258 start_codon:yes stop_codon:yes gene_type:complete